MARPGEGQRWVADGTNGQNALCAEAATWARALLLACEQARAAGMLAPPREG